MFILLLMLSAAPLGALSSSIPKVDGVDRSGFFHYMRQQFEMRRLFVSIVDTVSLNSSSSSLPLPSTVSILLQPHEANPDYYGFVSRKVVDALGCMDATNAEFEEERDPPKYVITVDKANTLDIYRDEEYSAEGEALLRRIALQAGMTKEEASKIELSDCWYMRSPEIMRINVAVAPGPKIRSGWIVERYPIGRISANPTKGYRYPYYLTNYSYIDALKEVIVDVQESRDGNGTRIWTPTGWPAFAMMGVWNDQASTKPDYTYFRETESGVLITTVCPTMVLAYQIDDEIFEERVTLFGHHYHVSCGWKEKEEGMPSIFPLESLDSNSTIFRGVNITLITSSNKTIDYYCNSKRSSPSGVPEITHLDHVEEAGSRPVPSSDRDVMITKIRPETTTIGLMDEEGQRPGLFLAAAFLDDTFNKEDDNGINQRIEDLNHELFERAKKAEEESRQAMMEREKREKEEIIRILLMVVFVVVLALFSVFVVAACMRQFAMRSDFPIAQVSISEGDEEENRRKDGTRLLPSPSAPRAPMESIDETEEEEQQSNQDTPAPIRAKRNITFAEDDELSNRLSYAELGASIDRMIDQEAVGEEEEEIEHVELPEEQNHEGGLTAFIDDVVDETSDEVFYEASDEVNDETVETSPFEENPV